MTYRKQRHRYRYQRHTSNKGHISYVGAQYAFCGKEMNGYSRSLTKFDEKLELCETCKQVLKRLLAEEYNVEGWVSDLPMYEGHG